MSYTEQSLKALTVVKLKEILSNHSLPVTGKKDDLISRILESNLGEQTEQTLDPTGQSTDEPDGMGVGTTQELAPAAQQTTKDGEEPSVTTAQQDQEQVEEEKVEEISEEDKLREREEAKKMEEEKRKQRLARFGGGGGGGESANGQVDAKEEEKKKRAERFGLNVNQDENDSTSKLNKSLDALDKPLGSNRRERKGPKSDKQALPSSKSTPSGEKTVAEKTGNVKAAAEPAAVVAELSPEQQKRLQEDEEKKKKRAARFGASTADSEPQEKKAKTD